MSASQLPENMGKKIVEALKRKAMFDEEETAPEEIVEESEIVEEPSAAIAEPESSLSETAFDTETKMDFSNISSPLPVFNTYSADIPTNVAVLRKLVNQLPPTVSKQVGAQIIRQTMEALGISMNSVLKEAQEVHNSLSAAVKECTLKAQEYKKEIMKLEIDMKDYQQQMAQINDIISVFILTEKR